MKKSAENRQISTVDNSKVLVMPRVKPPAELTSEQAREWTDLTNRMPADYFGAEHYPLMVQRHVVAARQIALLIEQESAQDDINVPVYLQLLKQQEIESRAVTALSRTMRLTHQSNIDPHTSRTPPVTVDARGLSTANKAIRFIERECRISEGPDIRHKTQRSRFAEMVIKGRKGTQMPAFGHRLSLDEVWQVPHL
jgi:hypothetical protein